MKEVVMNDNDDDHELGKAIFGIVLFALVPIFWMLYLLFQ